MDMVQGMGMGMGMGMDMDMKVNKVGCKITSH